MLPRVTVKHMKHEIGERLPTEVSCVDDSLMCHSLLGSEDSRCTVASTRNPLSVRVSGK